MQAMPKLTKRQAAVLAFITTFQEEEGVSPSHREIQKYFKFASRNAVTKHLTALRRRGLLAQSSRRARSLTPKQNAVSLQMLRIPLMGSIPAGMPTDQQQESDESVNIDAEALRISKTANIFALHVRGNSMENAAIIDGDTAVIESCEARDKDIVAALIDGEVTLKRYLVENGKPFLRAENDEFSDLIPAQELIIQGVFRALIRPNSRRF